jgi:multiple sugar transport system permease protein
LSMGGCTSIQRLHSSLLQSQAPMSPLQHSNSGRGQLLEAAFRRRVAWGALFAPALIYTVAVGLFPFAYAVLQSVHAADFLRMGAFVGLENFVEFLRARNGIGGSIVFCAGTLALTMPIGVGCALALTQIQAGRGFFRTLLIIPWLLSSVVVAKLWAWLVSAQLGPIAYFLQQIGFHAANPATSRSLAMPLLVIANTWMSFPLVTVMTFAALQTVPKELLDAAKIDGANRLQRTFLITIPVIKGSLFVGAVLTTINSLNNATLVLVLTGGGPNGATETVALRVFEEGFRFYRMGVATAGAVIIFALNAVFAAAYLRAMKSESPS